MTEKDKPKVDEPEVKKTQDLAPEGATTGFIVNAAENAKSGVYDPDPRYLYEDFKKGYDTASKGTNIILQKQLRPEEFSKFNDKYRELHSKDFNKDQYREDRSKFERRFRVGTEENAPYLDELRARLAAGEVLSEDDKSLPRYLDFLRHYAGGSPSEITDPQYSEAQIAMGYGGPVRQRNGKNLYYHYDPQNGLEFEYDDDGNKKGIKMYEDDGSFRGSAQYQPVSGNYAEDYEFWNNNMPLLYEPEEKGDRPDLFGKYAPDFGEEGIPHGVKYNPLFEFDPKGTVRDFRQFGRFMKDTEDLRNQSLIKDKGLSEKYVKNMEAGRDKRLGVEKPAVDTYDDSRSYINAMKRDIEAAYRPLTAFPEEMWESNDPSVLAAKKEVEDNIGEVWEKWNAKKPIDTYLGAYAHYKRQLDKQLEELKNKGPEGQLTAERIENAMSRTNNMPDVMKALAGAMAYHAPSEKYKWDYLRDRLENSDYIPPELYDLAKIDIGAVPRELKPRKSDMLPAYSSSIIDPRMERAYVELLAEKNRSEGKVNPLDNAKEQASLFRKGIMDAEVNGDYDKLKSLLETYQKQIRDMMAAYPKLLDEKRAQNILSKPMDINEIIENSKYRNDFINSIYPNRPQRFATKNNLANSMEGEFRRLLATERGKRDVQFERDMTALDEKIKNLKAIDRYEFIERMYDDTYGPDAWSRMMNDLGVENDAEAMKYADVWYKNYFDKIWPEEFEKRYKENQRRNEQRINNNPLLKKQQEINEANRLRTVNSQRGKRLDPKTGAYYKKTRKSDDDEEQFSQETVMKMETITEMVRKNNERAEQQRGYPSGVPIHGGRVFKNTAYPVKIGDDDRLWAISHGPLKKNSSEGSVKRV